VFRVLYTGRVIQLAMADVEMKPEDSKVTDQQKDKDKDIEKPPQTTPVAEIKSNVALIERAVSTIEPRFTHRVLRSFTALRKRTDAKVLRDAIEEIYRTG
jgi:26S proteasome regulatory subunit N3